MNDELRRDAMQACLDLSSYAMTIFDGLEAGAVTMDVARAVVAMGRTANEVALAVQTITYTEMTTLRRRS